MRWAISSHEACHAHISKLLPRSLCLCLSASLFTSLPLCLSLSLGASLTFSVFCPLAIVSLCIWQGVAAAGLRTIQCCWHSACWHGCL